MGPPRRFRRPPSPLFSAAPFVPDTKSLPKLRAAAKDCEGCPLYLPATQTVFGEGQSRARLMLVGEQPGDSEDISGHPFVGPAGQMLDRALADAGIDRGEVYVTNAVKHFKFEERGKWRIHKKPSASEVNACSPWLRAEIAVVKPQVIVALGATAAQALFGPAFRLMKQRGQIIATELASSALATMHPSALLRMRGREERHAAYAQLVEDLKHANASLGSKKTAKGNR